MPGIQDLYSGSRITSLPLITLLLSACGDNGPGPGIHDTKYLAVDASGQTLDASQPGKFCVLDQFTGLTWEVKSEKAGLHHWRNTYSWFDPDESHDGELDYRGIQNQGKCTASACDTAALVKAVNQEQFCGYSDWRMPSRDELGSISDPRKTGSPPTINLRFFPLTAAAEYWSSNDYQFQYDAAWVWSFKTGMDRVEWKKSPRHVRLVRGTGHQVARIKD